MNRIKIFPKIPTKYIKTPYERGLRAGILIGFGLAYIISSTLYHFEGLVLAGLVTATGIFYYYIDIKNIEKK
jgi:hypothetical protein